MNARVAAVVLLLLATAFPAPAVAEPVDPSLIIAALRESLATKGPVAERVRVSIKPLGKAAQSDEFVIKVDPGRRPDRSDAAMWLELGELRVYASSGQLVAVHSGDLTSCYTVEYGGPLRAETLYKLLPPIPAPLIGLLLAEKSADAANVTAALTPYTPRITWNTAEASGAPGAEIVTLGGVRDAFPGERPQLDDTRVTLTVDARTTRPTRFTAFLPSSAELRLEISPAVPGNPATWPIRFDHRAKVASLTDLRERRGDAAAAHVLPELNLIDAGWNSWDYRSVFRTDRAPTHLALIFTRETVKDAFGVPSPDAKTAEEELRRIEAELRVAQSKSVPATPGTPPRPSLVHLMVPVMLTMDDTSRRKVENAARLRASTSPDPARAPAAPSAPVLAVDADVIPATVMWAPSPERTIERFAPGAAAVCVVIRADNSLAGIVLLDGRAKDAAGIRADFRRILNLDPPTP